MARGRGRGAQRGRGSRAQQGAARDEWRPQPLGNGYKGEIDWKMAKVVFPDCVTDEDAMTIVKYVVRGQIGIVRNDTATICAQYHAAGAFKAKYGGADAEILKNLDIDLRLGCELVVYLRHYWLIAARVNRPRLAPTPAFVGQDFGTQHSTELSKILQRCHMGLVTCLRDSTADVVSKNLNALLSGCLCWGSLAEVLDPRAYSQFETTYFEPMKPFGAMVELSEVFVKLVDSIYTSARTQTEDEILHDFKDDHEVYGLTGLEQPLSFRVLPPFEYQGKKYRGAVWIRAPRHCFGKYCDISGKMSEEDIAQVRDSAPPPPSQVFYKIRDFLERCGASVPNSSFNAVCYESALFAHLRIHAPDIIDVIHFAGDDVAAKTVTAMICWNESGQTEVIGHWAFITKRPGSTDEPMIISTNDHFLSRDMRLFEEKIGDLVDGKARSKFNRHVGAVLRNFVTRVDASEHRQDASGERENVFIGSRWSDAERKNHLPHMAIRAAALVSVLASASGANNCWHRAFDDIEYVRSRRSAKKEYEMYEERFSAQLVSPVLLQRWAPRMFTRAGVVERLRENDRRQVEIAYAERQDSDPLTMWPLCNFIFFGVPHSPLREPKRERHTVDLQASEADEANMALM